jgi:hypothetical protein
MVYIINLYYRARARCPARSHPRVFNHLQIAHFLSPSYEEGFGRIARGWDERGMELEGGDDFSRGRRSLGRSAGATREMKKTRN